MSILIKGMKLPKDCRDCPMETFYVNCGDTRCRATNKLLAEEYNVIPFSGRPDWCPLVEVPTPHGRLIDADALKNYIENDGHTEAFAMAHIGREGKFFLMGNITADIDGQQTVIKAEEGEDE